MTAAKTRPRTKTERFELRLSAEIAHDLDAAAAALGVSKSQFACDAVSEKALKVLARSDVTLMDAQLFDHMMTSFDHPDPGWAHRALGRRDPVQGAVTPRSG